MPRVLRVQRAYQGLFVSGYSFALQQFAAAAARNVLFFFVLCFCLFLPTLV